VAARLRCVLRRDNTERPHTVPQRRPPVDR